MSQRKSMVAREPNGLLAVDAPNLLISSYRLVMSRLSPSRWPSCCMASFCGG